MKEIIREQTKDSRTLDDIKNELIDIFHSQREEGHTRIGYVAGVITSDGPEKMDENIKLLQTRTDALREELDYPIFSSTDVFTDTLFERLDAAGFVNEDWEEFWRQVLGSGYITDIFMTEGWERSHGATDEHKTAQEKDIQIHYPQEKNN